MDMLHGCNGCVCKSAYTCLPKIPVPLTSVHARFLHGSGGRTPPGFLIRPPLMFVGLRIKVTWRPSPHTCGQFEYIPTGSSLPEWGGLDAPGKQGSSPPLCAMPAAQTFDGNTFRNSLLPQGAETQWFQGAHISGLPSHAHVREGAAEGVVETKTRNTFVSRTAFLTVVHWAWRPCLKLCPSRNAEPIVLSRTQQPSEPMIWSGCSLRYTSDARCVFW